MESNEVNFMGNVCWKYFINYEHTDEPLRQRVLLTLSYDRSSRDFGQSICLMQGKCNVTMIFDRECS